jgi:hypothetical protein
MLTNPDDVPRRWWNMYPERTETLGKTIELLAIIQSLLFGQDYTVLILCSMLPFSSPFQPISATMTQYR